MTEYTPEDQALIDQVNAEYEAVAGSDRLWRWFGLSRAAWLTMPRVLMHEMSNEWQEKMARLLEEFDDTFDWADRQYYVTAKKGGKFMPLPDALCNYRHPRQEGLAQYRRAT